MSSFKNDLLGALDDFLSDELHHARETVGGLTGTVQRDGERLWIGLDDGRTFTLTLTEERG